MRFSLSLSLLLFSLVTEAQIAPDTLTVSLGKVQSGNVASLARDDMNALVVCKFFVPNQASPIVRFTCTADTGYPSCSDYLLRLKAKSVEAGTFQVTLSAYNYTLGVYSASTTQALGLDYAVTSIHVTNAAEQYLSLEGQVRAEVAVRQVGPSTAFLPCSLYEYLQWFLTP